MPLNLSRVAYACPDLATLDARIGGRCEGGEVRLTTRNRPRRADELVGGSLYWIIAHRLVARSPILGLADSEDGRTDIRIAARLIVVVPQPKRAHQGWRYLTDADAPRDLDDAGAVGDVLPAALHADLAGLGLV
jgi:hypothetical protein